MNSQQDLSLFEDVFDAMDGIVKFLGGYKKVGVLLRPELESKPESAAQWLRDCLNREKRERLDQLQTLHLLRLARQAGYHAAKHWLDAEVGYKPSQPIDRGDQVQQLVETIEGATDTVARALAALERLKASDVAMVVSAKFGGTR